MNDYVNVLRWMDPNYLCFISEENVALNIVLRSLHSFIKKLKLSHSSMIILGFKMVFVDMWDRKNDEELINRYNWFLTERIRSFLMCYHKKHAYEFILYASKCTLSIEITI